MNISVLNNSVNIAVDIDADSAVNAIATNAAMVAYKVVMFTLDRAVEDTLKVYSEVSKVATVVTDKVQADCNTVIDAGRSSGVAVEEAIVSTYSTAKAQVISSANDAVKTRDAIITATKIKLESLINKKVISPVQTKTAEVIAPVKATISQLEKAIAVYTKIEEVEVEAQEIDPIAIHNEINSALVEEKPQVIDGAIVSSAGVTNAIAFDEDTIVKGRKAAQSLTDMIKEEATKHNA